MKGRKASSRTRYRDVIRGDRNLLVSPHVLRNLQSSCSTNFAIYTPTIGYLIDINLKCIMLGKMPVCRCAEVSVCFVVTSTNRCPAE